MSGISIGDMVQQFTSLRNGGMIKSELGRLSQSLSSGKVDDLTAELGGGTERFSGLSYSLQQLDAYQTAARETAQLLSDTQTVLSRLDSLRNTTSERLLRVNEASTSAQVQEAAQSSRSTFDEMVRTLNTQIGDRALLGGARVDAAPLASAGDMMNAIATAIGGATDAATIITTVDDWFDAAGGGFVTMGYLGDTGPD
uniref:flagellin n=1 Tax=Yoonia sp. TaxID=2212373 RepID=UPI0035C7E5CB